MTRTIAAFLLLALAALGAAATPTTTFDCRSGSGRNVTVQATIDATERAVTITVEDGRPATIEFVSKNAGSVAWKLRSTLGDATTEIYVDSGQPVDRKFFTTTTLYYDRQSSSGTLSITRLE